jgi:hypothetical protein
MTRYVEYHPLLDSLAEPDCEWNSVCSSQEDRYNNPIFGQDGYVGAFKYIGTQPVLCLKATSLVAHHSGLGSSPRNKQDNRFVAPNVIWFNQSANPWKNYAKIAKDESEQSIKRIVVHFFSRFASSDHYLGEYAIVKRMNFCGGMCFLVLHRLEHQTAFAKDLYEKQVGKKRSKSEHRHLQEIKDALPSDWVINHEPAVSIGLNGLLISRGKLSNCFKSSEYTVDYIAHSGTGSRRICFESKYDDTGVTQEAIDKCKRLRDETMTRVFIVHGHGDELCWIDFGGPQSNTMRTYKTTWIGNYIDD